MLLFAWLHSNCRRVTVAAVFALLGSAAGCTFFDRDRLRLDHYRDDRAIDIERRLERTEPIVKNPF